MAKVPGYFGVLWIDDQAGTCRNMTGDTTAVTVNRSKALGEVTTLGNSTVQRIDGLRDYTLDVTAIFNSGSVDTIVGLLDNMWSNSTVARAQFLPGGSTTGCPMYTASMRLTSYTGNHPVDGPATLNFSLANAVGSPVSSCVA